MHISTKSKVQLSGYPKRNPYDGIHLGELTLEEIRGVKIPLLRYYDGKGEHTYDVKHVCLRGSVLKFEVPDWCGIGLTVFLKKSDGWFFSTGTQGEKVRVLNTEPQVLFLPVVEHWRSSCCVGLRKGIVRYNPKVFASVYHQEQRLLLVIFVYIFDSKLTLFFLKSDS